MASATGIPENVYAARGVSEEEPLLGRRGDASQPEGDNIFLNLWIGGSSYGAEKSFSCPYSY